MIQLCRLSHFYPACMRERQTERWERWTSQYSPEVNVRCLPHSLSTLIFETGSVNKPGTHWLNKASYLMNHNDLHVSASSHSTSSPAGWNNRSMPLYLAFACRRFKCRSASQHNQHVINWDIFPITKINIFFICTHRNLFRIKFHHFVFLHQTFPKLINKKHQSQYLPETWGMLSIIT